MARFNNFQKCFVIVKVDQKPISTNSLHGQYRMTWRKRESYYCKRVEREREKEVNNTKTSWIYETEQEQL